MTVRSSGMSGADTPLGALTVTAWFKADAHDLLCVVALDADEPHILTDKLREDKEDKTTCRRQVKNYDHATKASLKRRRFSLNKISDS